MSEIPIHGKVLDILLKPDGTIKTSDIPAGMSIASEWTAPDFLRIVIEGLALENGTLVDVTVLAEAYGGIMKDETNLATTGSRRTKSKTARHCRCCCIYPAKT